ncbi:MAG: CBS domain-containing protein [Planctomycetota bacterium]
MITIRQILNHKGDHVIGISSQNTLTDAARSMHEHGVGALTVHEGNDIIGLISERDLVLSLAQLGSEAANAAVAATMQPTADINVDDELMDGLRLMTDRRRRHLLVRQEGRCIGIVSIGDLVKAMHEEQVGTISSLHQYITG